MSEARRGGGNAAGAVVAWRHAMHRARRFGHDEAGVSAVFFGIVFAVIMLATAIAVDHGRLVTEVSRDRWALDAAVLAASDRLGTDDQDTSGKALARLFYDENRRDSVESEIVDIVLDAENGEVSARTQTTWHSTLLKAFGYDTVDLGVSARVVRGDGTVEVALVLDNSGSMAGSYIEELRTASKDLVDIVFAGAEGTDKVKVGVVPFAASVNVGPDNADESWMDQSGGSSIHHIDQLAGERRTRQQLFSDLGVAWAGCVEVRPGAHATSDSLPSDTDADSLFVPMFAPDEPDPRNDQGNSYNNSYVVDDGGSCTPQACNCTKTNKQGACTNWSLAKIASAAEAQARTCKYAGGGSVPADSCSRGSQDGPGPNYMCTTRPLLALSQDKTEVKTAIDAMGASGNTNIGEGVMWGWRVLSPTLPFAEGRSYDDVENKKALIVMTDGQNTYSSSSNHNKSRYGAYGYADPYEAGAEGRLGTTYTSTAYVSQMTQNTRTACANAKAAGITVFSVAFRLESDPATQALLRECASGTDKVFVASNGDALIQSFQNIGRQISQLRISD